ncbi:MAG TPA: enoyl-CoA hydratase [Actinomycetota bacterium]
MEQITYERDGGVGWISLNRPDKLNALTSVMSDELCDVLEELRDDDEVRAVVLTGAGRGFCAGQDLTEFRDTGDAGDRLDIEQHLAETYHRLIPLMVESPKPVIAGVNGVAAGAGLSLAIACDVRIAGEEARFTQAFVKIGLIPDSGGTYLLPRIVGYAKALELSMSGEMIDAAEAHRIGLVSRVTPAADLEEEVRAYAAALAAMPTLAIAEAKRLLRDALTLDLREALHREAKAQARMGATEDFREGVTAFVEKREPSFRGR